MKIVCLWSGPRNVSTALMYSFAQRADTVVIDEPLYGHYLRLSGAEQNLSNARSNLESARRRVQDQRSQVQRAKEELAREPQTKEEPVYSNHSYTIETHTLNGELSVAAKSGT